MNRRSFLKAMAGAAASSFVVPDLIVPERRVFALDRTMLNLPPRYGVLPRDQTAWLQWHIDNGLPIPTGHYRTDAPLIVSPNSKGMIMTNSRIIGTHTDGPVLEFRRKPEYGRDWLESNYISSQEVHDRVMADMHRNRYLTI